MKKLLGITAIALTLAFSVKAELIEVTVEGEFTSNNIGEDFAYYMGNTYQYSFQFDDDPLVSAGTYVDINGNLVNWDVYYNDNSRSWHAELTSDPIITEIGENYGGTDYAYGVIDGIGQVTFSMGEDFGNQVRMRFGQQPVATWVARSVDESGNTISSGTILDLREKHGGGQLSGTFEIVSIEPVTSSVPEPSTLSMLIGGLSMLGFAYRRKK